MEKTRFAKKLKISLTLNIFDLDWGLALSHRNAIRHTRFSPLSMSSEQGESAFSEVKGVSALGILLRYRVRLV